MVSAPAVVLSLVLGWDLTATSLLITAPAVVYTMFGGVQAVTWTDVKIMVLIVIALFAMVAAAIIGLPAGVGLGDGLSIAAATGRLKTFDFSFDLTNQYTFWSGTIAALFLFCSYFGTDQSQVQRYLTARSVDEARHSLLMSAYWKIPLQFLVLFLGVLVFVFYIFTPPPVLFSKVHTRAAAGGGDRARPTRRCKTEFDAAIDARRDGGDQHGGRARQRRHRGVRGGEDVAPGARGGRAGAARPRRDARQGERRAPRSPTPTTSSRTSS